MLPGVICWLTWMDWRWDGVLGLPSFFAEFLGLMATISVMAAAIVSGLEVRPAAKWSVAGVALSFPLYIVVLIALAFYP